jgi:hypothetical protein
MDRKRVDSETSIAIIGIAKGCLIDKLDKNLILEALRRTGDRLAWPHEVEVVIVGGAAGMILGLWRPERVTEDADIAEISPPHQPRRALLAAARATAEELGLSLHWLNDDFIAFGALDTLPDDWRMRCVEIGRFGQLRVVSPGKRDLLAMKVYAGRPQDIEDVMSCLPCMTRDDLDFIRDYLTSLDQPHRRHIDPGQLERAKAILEGLEQERFRP